MALDAVVEVVARAVGHVLLEVVLVGVFYWPGWLICRMITFGRYPPSQDVGHNRELVAGVALVTLIVAVTIYYSPG